MSRTSTLTAIACLTVLASACGPDRATGPKVDTTPLGGAAPSPLSATPVTNARITLTWNDKSPNETGFEVHRSTSGATGYFTRVSATLANVNSYDDVGLTPNSEYCYAVRAFRASGADTVYSPLSNTVCAVTFGPPDAPTDVTARPQAGDYYGPMILVAWNASSSASAATYRVDRSDGPDGPWVARTGQSSVRAVGFYEPTERLICYRVLAFDSYGDASLPSGARCTAVPAAPTDLTARGGASGGVDLAWIDASQFEDGYEIQRSDATMNFSIIGSTPANATSYHDASAVPDKPYWYRIRAKKDGGYSEFSSQVEAIAASAPPNAPTGLYAIPSASSTVRLRWTSVAANTSGLRLERSVGGGAWLTIGTSGSGWREFYDAHVDPDVEACYRVVAVNGKGESPPSATDCARPIKAPSALVATAVGRDAIDLAWVDESGFETSYEVHRVKCFKDSFYGDYCNVVEVVRLAAGAASWHAVGLTPGTEYRYEVVAIGTKGTESYSSDPSNQVSATTAP